MVELPELRLPLTQFCDKCRACLKVLGFNLQGEQYSSDPFPYSLEAARLHSAVVECCVAADGTSATLDAAVLATRHAIEACDHLAQRLSRDGNPKWQQCGVSLSDAARWIETKIA